METINKKKVKKRKKGGGRKSLYGEPSVSANFRVPKSKAKEIRATFQAILQAYRINN